MTDELEKSNSFLMATSNKIWKILHECLFHVIKYFYTNISIIHKILFIDKRRNR